MVSNIRVWMSKIWLNYPEDVFINNGCHPDIQIVVLSMYVLSLGIESFFVAIKNNDNRPCPSDGSR